MTAKTPAQGDVEAAVRAYLAGLARRYLPVLAGVLALLLVVVVAPSTSPSAEADPAAPDSFAELEEGGALPEGPVGAAAVDGAEPAEGAAAPAEGGDPAAPADPAGHDDDAAPGSGGTQEATGSTGGSRACDGGTFFPYTSAVGWGGPKAQLKCFGR